MPSRQTVQDFIALVEQGHYLEAIEQFYAPDASMQENSQPPRRGRETLLAYERAVMAACSAMRTLPVESCLVDGDLVVIHWVFEFTRLSGKTMRIDELAHQRWQGEKIVEERFFYDPVAALAD
ncbi:nuclear transport factor 2 family protein [Polaromonas sp. SM01]|uniref:nuclear transport factor 2 family protein n=1 Tax=Polaromonas sp. SM01 TaxID=3085630 RepID=UPI0029823D64|nr:nuclear transport factor 2 family protein [Polaromonas sp. SM01]MDW5441873.1 nuclear transport factor 2 family protein [Polaromonas sp. SM01]